MLGRVAALVRISRTSTSMLVRLSAEPGLEGLIEPANDDGRHANHFLRKGIAAILRRCPSGLQLIRTVFALLPSPDGHIPKSSNQ